MVVATGVAVTAAAATARRRGREWDGDGGDGNPAAAAIVSEHLLGWLQPVPTRVAAQSSTVALLVGMVTSTSVMLLIL